MATHHSGRAASQRRTLRRLPHGVLGGVLAPTVSTKACLLVPRTHGCLRLHQNAAPKFFALVRTGTPFYIADSLPEDQTSARICTPTTYNIRSPRRC